jgi:hypothetical protein
LNKIEFENDRTNDEAESEIVIEISLCIKTLNDLNTSIVNFAQSSLMSVDSLRTSRLKFCN